MATYNEMLQTYVNADYSELLSIGQKALVAIMPACQAVDEQNKGMFMLTSLILTAVAADGVLTAKEHQFLCDLLNFDSDTVQKYIKMYDSRMVELVDKFADSLKNQYKAEVIALILCVVACDEKISREENAFIRKILD